MTNIRFSLKPYKAPFIHKQIRQGALIKVFDELGSFAYGEVSPLPGFNKETLEEALEELSAKEEKVCSISWTKTNLFTELEKLNLLPSSLFGLETALLSLLDPLPITPSNTSALLMGSFSEIVQQAKQHKNKTSAKLKVSNLSYKEAKDLIHLLKDRFSLRIDVNRAWESKQSLEFFSEFPKDTFDYVEEPFKNPKELPNFTHPLAVDESFPFDLSLNELELLPSLKTLIYKPMIQGGMTRCIPLAAWAKKQGIELVLSSSFETSVGLHAIASMAKRLSITSPLGLGTSYFYPCPFQGKIVNS